MKNQIYKSIEGKELIIDHYDSLLKKWPVAYKEMYIDTAYGETYVLESGNKDLPPIVLLHGSSSNSAMWMADVETLCNEYNVFLIDILGEPGKSAENRLDLKSKDHALWLKEVFNELKIDNTSIIGNSLGGWMALKFATEYPHMINKLVLISTSGITPAKVSFVFKAIYFIMQGDKGIKKLNQVVFDSDKIPDEVLRTTTLIMKNFNPLIGSLPIYSATDIKKIQAPILFIGGENDALLPSKKTAERLKEIAINPTTLVLENRGHAIFDVTSDIMAFL